MRRLLLLSLLASLASADTTSAQVRQRGPGRSAEDDFRERYDVIVQRNIFLRERRRPSEPTTAPAPAPPPPPPESGYALVGIVLEDGAYRAYFERRPSGGVVRLSIGDPVARGIIAAIEIDAVLYQSEQGSNWVELGQDLSGRGAVAATTPATSSGGGGSPDEPGLSIEERLRRRRAQELGH